MPGTKSVKATFPQADEIKGIAGPKGGLTTMTDFNPLAGAILGSTQAQNILGGEKQRQVRRAQNLRKDFAVREDHFEAGLPGSIERHRRLTPTRRP